MSDIHDPISVTILDTATGRTVVNNEWSYWWWSEGNGSCDCNRANFMGDDCESEGCLGRHRYLIAEASGLNLSDFNGGYPAELLARHVTKAQPAGLDTTEGDILAASERTQGGGK